MSYYFFSISVYLSRVATIGLAPGTVGILYAIRSVTRTSAILSKNKSL